MTTEGTLIWKTGPGQAGRVVTEATHATRAAADPIHLAHLGVPPEVLGDGDWDDGGEAPAPLPCPLHLTSAEVEVLLCFALTSPLHYGPVEEGLCEKLRHHLYGAYKMHAASATAG